MQIEENENSLLDGKDFEMISYEWMFVISKAKYQEQEGVPIVRIMSQLSSIYRLSYSELEQWVRNPEGIWDSLVKKRNDLKTSGGHK